MYDTMYIEEIKSDGIRKNLSEMAQRKYLELKSVNLGLEEEWKENRVIFNNAKDEFSKIEGEYRQRNIKKDEYEQVEGEYGIRRDSLELTRVSLEMKKNANSYLQERLRFLVWLLQFPYGASDVPIVKPQTGEKAVAHKRDIYNSYFGSVMEAEKARLMQERDFLRMQFTFSNHTDAIHYEYYASKDSIREKLEDVKNQLQILQECESQIGGNYVDFIDCSKLTVEDFMSDNSKYLFEKMFLKSDEDKKRRAV